MKKLIILVLVLPLLGIQSQAQEFENEMDSISYMLGADMARNLSNQGMELSPEFVYQGMKDIFDGKESSFDQATVQQLMVAFQTQMQNAQMAKMQAASAENEAKGAAFLAENGQKEGVTTTASGLQYEVLTPGTGASPVATDVVEVHYEGKLLSGEIFDSSIQRGQPATFPLNQVIRGWTEGVQLMKEGAKYRFFIPGNLAYGPQGSPPKIGPGELLVFDVELISIKQP